MDPALAGLPSVHGNTLEQWLANMAPNYRQCTMPRKYMHNAAEEAQQLKRPNIGGSELPVVAPELTFGPLPLHVALAPCQNHD